MTGRWLWDDERDDMMRTEILQWDQRYFALSTFQFSDPLPFIELASANSSEADRFYVWLLYFSAYSTWKGVQLPFILFPSEGQYFFVLFSFWRVEIRWQTSRKGIHSNAASRRCAYCISADLCPGPERPEWKANRQKYEAKQLIQREELTLEEELVKLVRHTCPIDHGSESSSLNTLFRALSAESVSQKRWFHSQRTRLLRSPSAHFTGI